MMGVIWKKSIFNNDYKCTRCGKRLCDKKGYPINVYETPDSQDKEEVFIYCQKCDSKVGIIKELPDSLINHLDLKENQMNVMGNFTDFVNKLDKQSTDMKNKIAIADKKIQDYDNLKRELEKTKQEYNSLKQRCIDLENRINNNMEKYLKELKEKDAEINRLYNIIQTNGGN